MTKEERARNQFGDSWSFVHDGNADAYYASSLPGIFPDLTHCRARKEKFDLPTLGGLSLVKGLCEGVLLGKDAVSGFPSLKTLPHSGVLDHHGVNIFQGDSRNRSIVLTIDNVHGDSKVEELASAMIGEKTYIGWPFLQEGLVVALSDDLFRYELDQRAQGRSGIISIPHHPEAMHSWRKTAERIQYTYSKRCGVLIGPVTIVQHVRLLTGESAARLLALSAEATLGLKRMEDGAMVKDYEDKEQDFAVQATLQRVSAVDQRFLV